MNICKKFLQIFEKKRIKLKEISRLTSVLPEQIHAFVVLTAPRQ